MKIIKNQTEIKEGLNAVEITIKHKEPDYNLIYLTTPFGKKIIRTELTLENWLKEQQMKPKPQMKKKKRK